jgi:hypothetical protein
VKREAQHTSRITMKFWIEQKVMILTEMIWLRTVDIRVHPRPTLSFIGIMWSRAKEQNTLRKFLSFWIAGAHVSAVRTFES